MGGCKTAAPCRRLSSLPSLCCCLWQKKEVRGTKWFAESDAYPGRFGAAQGAEVKQRGARRRPARPLALPEALRLRWGPDSPGTRHTPLVLHCQRDSELCPSPAAGRLLGAVVFLPSFSPKAGGFSPLVLGSVQETVTSFL